MVRACVARVVCKMRFSGNRWGNGRYLPYPARPIYYFFFFILFLFSLTSDPIGTKISKRYFFYSCEVFAAKLLQAPGGDPHKGSLEIAKLSLSDLLSVANIQKELLIFKQEAQGPLV